MFSKMLRAFKLYIYFMLRCRLSCHFIYLCFSYRVAEVMFYHQDNSICL
uniref:Uncharacterized protein n=1 Tax=Ciona intestinalis TaxID=7719 RepID=H2Y3N8_CIOIN